MNSKIYLRAVLRSGLRSLSTRPTMNWMSLRIGNCSSSMRVCGTSLVESATISAGHRCERGVSRAWPQLPTERGGGSEVTPQGALPDLTDKCGQLGKEGGNCSANDLHVIRYGRDKPDVGLAKARLAFSGTHFLNRCRKALDCALIGR